MGPCAITLSSEPVREYTKRAPAASYVPAADTANSPFIMYDPLDIFKAVSAPEMSKTHWELSMFAPLPLI